MPTANNKVSSHCFLLQDTPQVKEGLGADLRSHCARDEVSGWKSGPSENMPTPAAGRAMLYLQYTVGCRAESQEAGQD